MPRALTGPMAAMAASGADLLVGLTPVAQFLVCEGPIALEGGAELDRRHLGLRVRGSGRPPSCAAAIPANRSAGTTTEIASHSSLDIDMRARSVRGNGARNCSARRAQSDVREREEVGRGRPAERRAAATARRRTSRFEGDGREGNVRRAGDGGGGAACRAGAAMRAATAFVARASLCRRHATVRGVVVPAFGVIVGVRVVPGPPPSS